MDDKGPGLLLTVSGPSGAGKSTVIGAVMKNHPDMFFSVSATTRAPREGETPGVHYHFLTEEEFIRDREAGRFLEWAGFAGRLYGTPKAPVIEKVKRGYIVVLDIETNGARQVAENYPDGLSVYITPSSAAEVEARLRKRGTEAEDEIWRRMAVNREAYAHIGRYDYIVVNDNLPAAVSRLEAILLAERSRTKRLPGLVRHFTTA